MPATYVAGHGIREQQPPLPVQDIDRVLVMRSEEVSDHTRATLILSLELRVTIRRRQDAQGVIVSTVPTMVRSG